MVKRERLLIFFFMVEREIRWPKLRTILGGRRKHEKKEVGGGKKKKTNFQIIIQVAAHVVHRRQI